MPVVLAVGPGGALGRNAGFQAPAGAGSLGAPGAGSLGGPLGGAGGGGRLRILGLESGGADTAPQGALLHPLLLRGRPIDSCVDEVREEGCR